MYRKYLYIYKIKYKMHQNCARVCLIYCVRVCKCIFVAVMDMGGF
jgi:hypothetical protein